MPKKGDCLNLPYILIKGDFFDDEFDRGCEIKKDNKELEYVIFGSRRLYLADIPPNLMNRTKKPLKLSKSLYL